ncbi:MAG TPA: hypothetical protein VL068_13665 [Microthrixaceae bacterium]|nr:hypothetical protein [Microthrixaceae bacterium]
MQTEVPTRPLALDLSQEQIELFGSDVVAVVVPADDPLFRQVESVEAQVFPETPELFDVPDADDLFQFLLIVKGGEACHAVRLSAPGLVRGRSDLVPFFVTDLVESGEISRDDFDGHYHELGVKLERTFSVETNFRMGPHLEPIRSADLAYLSLFAIEDRFGADALFAHLNEPAITSLDRVGIHWKPVAGRPELKTPTLGSDGERTFDPDYQPICIIGQDPGNKATTEMLAGITPPLHVL